MTIDDIIHDLKAEMQTLEDLKTQISEAQENIRETISECQIIKEGNYISALKNTFGPENVREVSSL